MGLRSMFKAVKNAAVALNGRDDESSNFEAMKTNVTTETAPLRFEKAVIAMNGIVSQVSKIDPDGVDVICFPGSGGEGGLEHDIYRNVKDIKGLEGVVTAHEPSGPCKMGQAMDVVLKEAFAKIEQGKSSSILVLTAGRPDDHDSLTESMDRAAKSVKSAKDLTITFVQVGDDEWATKYLKHLDDNLTTTNADGEHIDIVDSIKDEEIQAALKEIKNGTGSSGATGALAGAFAGAALGVGGMYLANKMYAEKRKEGWNGRWRASVDGCEIGKLTVKDDMEGVLDITGWPNNETGVGNYIEMDNGGLNLMHMSPDNPEYIVVGTVEDEHSISWDDGTRWEEIPPSGVHWTKYAGAAVAGAVVGGATGFLLEKKFFNKASKNIESDYVIVLDRSQMMAVPDTGE